MQRPTVLRLIVAAVCACITGCATTPMPDRARIINVPLARAHADISFSMTTGFRQNLSCNESSNCTDQADAIAAIRFAQQVQRVATTLQNGAQHLYPDLAQRTPGLLDGRFDVYVVDGDIPESHSSADGRIAITSAIGRLQPYDDWLAFVIAREMGHVIARHHEENSSASITTSIIMNILIPGSSLIKSAMSAGGSRIAALSKRTIQAQEADNLSHQLLKAAGYRLRDVSLSLLIAPALLDDGAWSINFKTSADNLLNEVRNAELLVSSFMQEQ